MGIKKRTTVQYSKCVHVFASVSTQGPPGERGERGEPGDEGYQVDKTIKSTSDVSNSHHTVCTLAPTLGSNVCCPAQVP